MNELIVNNHLRAIKYIKFPDTPTAQDPIVRHGENELLQWFDADYGDHGEAWVLHLKAGVEIARYNARFIETVCWATANPRAEHE